MTTDTLDQLRELLQDRTPAELEVVRAAVLAMFDAPAAADAKIDRQQAAGLAALDLFASQYSPAVVRELRNSVLELLHKGIGPSVPEAVSYLSTFNDFLDVCAGDDYSAERVRARAHITDADLADDLHRAIGQTLAALVEHGQLAAWM